METGGTCGRNEMGEDLELFNKNLIHSMISTSSGEK